MPIAGMGILSSWACYLIYLEEHDIIVAEIAVASMVTAVVRYIQLGIFERQSRNPMSINDLQRWEILYAAGSWTFAALLGILSTRVLRLHAPLNHLICISLVFTFCAGLVARTAGRPVICIMSVLIASLPTGISLFLYAHDSVRVGGYGSYFIVEGLLVLVVTLLSLETVRHLYISTVEQLMIKHNLAFLVRQDALTGLPNRLLLRERFQTERNREQLPGSCLALHYLDLDGFKAINDHYGHPTGDMLLLETANRLKLAVRASDTVARIGGDEFVILQCGIHHRQEADMLARRVIKQLTAPFVIKSKEMEISVSVGIAMTPDDGLDFDDLSACADSALYRSKRGGKGRVNFWKAAPSLVASDENLSRQN